MPLTEAQKAQFVRDGYLKFENAVPADLIRRARRAINHSLGQGIDPEQLPTFRAQSYAPELQESQIITDLLHESDAWRAAVELIGEQQTELRRKRGQIALRFPKAIGDDSTTFGCHVDGFHTPTNGVPKGEVHSFTALVGIYVDDVPEANSGNFTVWPGTHRMFGQWCKQNDPAELNAHMKSFDLPDPVQVTGQAGDAFLAHYQLAHGIAPNLSPNIRYACFFRLQRPNRPNYHPDAMRDIWLEWDGIDAGRAAAV